MIKQFQIFTLEEKRAIRLRLCNYMKTWRGADPNFYECIFGSSIRAKLSRYVEPLAIHSREGSNTIKGRMNGYTLPLSNTRTS